MKIKNTVTNLILTAFFQNFYLRHLLSLVPLVFLLIHLITAVTLEKTEEARSPTFCRTLAYNSDQCQPENSENTCKI